MNIVETILSEHLDSPRRVVPGDIVEVSIDKAILLDMLGQHPEFTANPPKRLFDPEKVAMVFDHMIPAPTVEWAEAHNNLRSLAKKWGLTQFYDCGRGGISHALAAEKGWLLPGRIVANGDSHTCATGAFNCLGRGLGVPEMMSVVCTGRSWYIIGETYLINLAGKLHPGVEAKDVFLSLAEDLGSIPNQNVEFGGEGIKDLSLDERAVLTTMCAEISAEFAVFPCDQIVDTYLRARAEGPYKPTSASPDAEYKDKREVNLSEMSPLVALPDAIPGNVKSVAEVAGTRITQAVIGSCSNGRLADLETAALILNGRKVHADVRLIVTPATQETYQQANRHGYIQKIMEAGGLVTGPTCGSCFGGHMGLLGAGDVCITSTTRNFKGRMGSRDAKIYLGSSATVAASAVNGAIADPRAFF